MAAKAMKAGMEILRPLLAETGAPRIGTLVIGTVKGDIHDIGKNLVGMMMEGAGFQVVNLGINTDVEKFLHAVREHAADILGMSALLTTTMPYMRIVIQALKESGLREKLIVLVGGAPLNADFAEADRRRRLLPRRGEGRRDGQAPHGREDGRRPCLTARAGGPSSGRRGRSWPMAPWGPCSSRRASPPATRPSAGTSSGPT